MSSQKRISASRTYNIKRKQGTWITKVNPGPHDKSALPLNVLLRDVLKITRNARESKRVLHEGKVLVDGLVRKDPRFPVGLFDVVSIPLAKKYFRVVFDHIGRLKCVNCSKKESDLKIVKILRKARKDKLYQLTTNDGRNFNVKLSEGKKYNCGDSLLIKIPSQEIVNHLPFVKGASVYITGGKKVGSEAELKGLEDNTAVIIVNKEEHRTIKDYVFIVGDKKSELVLNE